jgi:hypothetical protein
VMGDKEEVDRVLKDYEQKKPPAQTIINPYPMWCS